MSQLDKPFDEICIKRLATGCISEYRKDGVVVFKLFDSEGTEAKVLARMIKRMERQVECLS